MKNRDYEDELKNFDKDMNLDLQDLSNTDIKINPSFYHHLNLVKAQESLLKDDARSGILQFYINAEFMETLCEASKNLPKDYYDKVKEIKDHENSDDLIGMAKAANQKYKIILSFLFARIEQKGAVNVGLPKKEKVAEHLKKKEDVGN